VGKTVGILGKVEKKERRKKGLIELALRELKSMVLKGLRLLQCCLKLNILALIQAF
jgi:hypothetical protein